MTVPVDTLPPPPPPPVELSTRERRWVREMLAGADPVQAARRAGFGAEHAGLVAADLLRRPHVMRALAVKQTMEQARVSAEDVLREYASIAFTSVHDLYDDAGELLAPHELPSHVASAVSEVTQDQRVDGTVRIRYKLAPKGPALEALAKMLGLFEIDNAQRGEALGRGLAEGAALSTLDVARRIAYLLHQAKGSVLEGQATVEDASEGP